MLEREYRREMDAVALTAEQKEKLVDVMTGAARAPGQSGQAGPFWWPRRCALCWPYPPWPMSPVRWTS